MSRRGFWFVSSLFRTLAALAMGLCATSLLTSPASAASGAPIVDYSLTLDGGAWVGVGFPSTTRTSSGEWGSSSGTDSSWGNTTGSSFTAPAMDATLRITWHVGPRFRLGMEVGTGGAVLPYTRRIPCASHDEWCFDINLGDEVGSWSNERHEPVGSSFTLHIVRSFLFAFDLHERVRFEGSLGLDWFVGQLGVSSIVPSLRMAVGVEFVLLEGMTESMVARLSCALRAPGSGGRGSIIMPTLGIGARF